MRCFNFCRAPLPIDFFKTSYALPNPKFSILLHSISLIALQQQFQWRISPPTHLPEDPSLTLSLIWTASYWVNSLTILASLSPRPYYYVFLMISYQCFYFWIYLADLLIMFAYCLLLLVSKLLFFYSALVTITFILRSTS